MTTEVNQFQYTSYLDYAYLHRAKSTQNAVIKSIRDYLRFVISTPQATDIDLLGIQQTYFKRSSSKIFDDLTKYIDYIDHHKKNSPNTIKLKLHYIIAWIEHNNVVISRTNKKILRNLLPRAIVVSEETEITRNILQRLISNADEMTKTIIHIMSSSGMRISELLGIRFEDIIFGDPTEIHISHERMKAGKPHIYYISQEATANLNKYLETRSTLNKCSKKPLVQKHHEIGVNYKIFPISYGTAANRFITAEKNAGLYSWSHSGKRSKITYHSIRKWTESTMKLYIPSNIANELVGHDEGLSTHYRRYDRKRLAHAYKIVEPYLSLSNDIIDNMRIHSKDEKLQLILDQQSDIIRRVINIESLLVVFATYYLFSTTTHMLDK